MTRRYAARRLLEHGPLTFSQIRTITGWPQKITENLMRKMFDQRQVERFFVPGCNRFVYRLPADYTAPARVFAEGV